MKTENLRKATFDTSSGKNVSSTSQLKGEAKKTTAETEKNRTVQEYTGEGAGSGPWGGKNTGS